MPCSGSTHIMRSQQCRPSPPEGPESFNFCPSSDVWLQRMFLLHPSCGCYAGKPPVLGGTCMSLEPHLIYMSSCRLESFQTVTRRPQTTCTVVHQTPNRHLLQAISFQVIKTVTPALERGRHTPWPVGDEPTLPQFPGFSPRPGHHRAGLSALLLHIRLSRGL